MLEFIKNNYEWIISAISLIATGVVAIIYYVKRVKAMKGAKTEEEKIAILNEIKASTYGFISIAEQLFSDIPKSGSSKLLYVLNNIKELCIEKSVEYDVMEWTEFINEIVTSSNDVIKAKQDEQLNADFVEKVKKEIPYMVDEANRLFLSIPDSTEYKIEYILKGIAILCGELSVNVFDYYDWKTYITNTYYDTTEKGA